MDLNLSESLGGLRITNPDDSSPGSAPSSRGEARGESLANLTQVISNNSVDSQLSPTPMTSEQPSARPLSTIDFDPNSFSTDSITIDRPLKLLPLNNPREEPPPLQHAQPQRAYSQRKQPRQTLPPTFQSQQQAQFPSYPVPKMQQPFNTSVRPVSMVQGPPGGQAPLPQRDPSYRLHRESSQSSLHAPPRRTSSRSAHQALQAGVPMRETSNPERSYRGANGIQPHAGNGPLPPRKSSRGTSGSYAMPGSAGAVNGSYPPPPNGTRARAPSGSPYGTEGGPMQSSEEWQERGAVSVMRKEVDANGNVTYKPVKKGVKDFNFGRTLGEGSYSTVLYAEDWATRKAYAIKVLDKKHIIKERKVKYVNIEKDVLNRLTDHPGVVKLYFTFQDERSLYFVLDIASNGELLGVLKKFSTFDEECTRFYAAQILDTIGYMHSKNVLHRDLKPENVLLDDAMHVKITDFGTAKILDLRSRQRSGSSAVPLPGDQGDATDDTRAQSFVGTAEYVSPELLTEKNAGKASDLWAFGCIIYQMLAGRPPFKAGNEYLTFQKIVALEYTFPQGFPPVARDLVERLLVLDPSRRLSIEHIKNHDFFKSITWGRSLWRQKVPKIRSYRPPIPGPIKLGGDSAMNGPAAIEPEGSYLPDVQPSHSTRPVHLGGPHPPVSRPSPRVITELPPPSQLDIEYSPILTRKHERIIKLGNLIVSSVPNPNSPTANQSAGSKFSRFFGGGDASKKRQRMVMVTSSGRVLVTDNDKKSKLELSLTDSFTVWKKVQDGKGLTSWVVETRDKHTTFEDLPPSKVTTNTPTPSSTAASAQDWLEALQRAKEIAHSEAAFADSHDFSLSRSGLPSPSQTLSRTSLAAQTPGSMSPSVDDLSTSRKGSGFGGLGRSSNVLTRNKDGGNAGAGDGEPKEKESRGFKRFSKRQSRSGLTAVF